MIKKKVRVLITKDKSFRISIRIKVRIVVQVWSSFYF